MDLLSLLLIRAATAYRMLADCSSSLGHLGRSICQARMGLQCTGQSVFPLIDNRNLLLTAAVLAIGDDSPAGKRNSAVARALEPGLCASAGDALVQMARVPSSDVSRFEVGFCILVENVIF
jgi:hypothetical protein